MASIKATAGRTRPARSICRRRLMLGFCSTLVTLAGCAIALEAYARLASSYYTPATLREQSLEYKATVMSRHAFPRMVQEKRWDSGSASINERGYRGPAFAVPKPAGLVRVVIIGGSSVFDTHSWDGEDWPHLVERRLRDKGIANVEVINAGIPGHASWDALARLYGEIWMFEPDVVLQYGAWNDIKYFRWLDPDRSLLQRIPPQEMAPGSTLVANPFIYYTGTLDRWLSHSQLYVRVRQGSWRARVGKLGFEGALGRDVPGGQGTPTSAEPEEFGRWGSRQYGLNLRLFAAAAEAIGATPVFVTEARLATPTSPESDRAKIGVNYSYAQLSHEGVVQAYSQTDAALRGVAAEKRVAVIDASAQLTGRTEFFVDLVHTTQAGSRRLAASVADGLLPVLQQRVRAAAE